MRYFLLIYTWCICIYAFAQPFQKGLTTSILDSFQQCINRSVKMKNLDSQAIYIGNLALAYQNQNEFIQALDLYDNAIRIGKEIRDTAIIAGNLRNAGMIYKEQGVYDRALENLLQASTYFERMYEEYGDSFDGDDLASCYNSTGNMYQLLNQNTLALEYYRAGLRLRLKSQNKVGIAGSFNFIGEFYSDNGEYDSALFYLNSSLKVKDQLDSPSFTATTLMNIGEVYLKMNDLPKAESYFKNVAFNPAIGKTKSVKAEACFELASLYNKQGKLSEALKFSDQSIGHAQVNSLKPILLNNYELRRRIYLKLKDYPSIVHYDSLYIHLKAEVLDEQKNRALVEARIRHETDKKEKELFILNKLKDAQSLWISMLIIVVILFGVLLVVYRRGAKKEKKGKMQIKLLMRELNHRVKNNFMLLQSLLSIQKSKVKDVRVKEEIRAIENRLQAMINIHKRLYHDGNITSIDLKLFIEDMVKDLKHSYEYRDGVRMNMKLEPIHLNIDSAIPLGLIMNEIISNVFKHAFKEINEPVLTIQMASKDFKWFSIIIQDNGLGKLDEHSLINGYSFGLKMIKLLSEQIHAKIKVESDKGVLYELILEKK